MTLVSSSVNVILHLHNLKKMKLNFCLNLIPITSSLIPDEREREIRGEREREREREREVSKTLIRMYIPSY